MSKSKRLFLYLGMVCSGFFCFIVLAWTGVIFAQTPQYPAPAETLGVSVEKSLTVSARVGFDLNAYIRPEKRIPVDGNDSLQTEVTLRRNGNTVYNRTVTTDSNGFAHLPDVSVENISPGEYTVSIKGLSHLRRNYTKVVGNRVLETLDLRNPTLKAGDAHVPSDNYVNSLDVAYLTNHIYGNDIRGDQNRDGIINSLDYSVTISNLYVHGDE